MCCDHCLRISVDLTPININENCLAASVHNRLESCPKAIFLLGLHVFYMSLNHNGKHNYLEITVHLFCLQIKKSNCQELILHTTILQHTFLKNPVKASILAEEIAILGWPFLQFHNRQWCAVK